MSSVAIVACWAAPRPGSTPSWRPTASAFSVGVAVAAKADAVAVSAVAKEASSAGDRRRDLRRRQLVGGEVVGLVAEQVAQGRQAWPEARTVRGDLDERGELAQQSPSGSPPISSAGPADRRAGSRSGRASRMPA